MNEHDILSARALAEYIRLKEHETDTDEESGHYAYLMARGQESFELAAADHRIQQQLLASSDEDLDLIIHSNGHLLPLMRLMDESCIDLEFHAESKDKALSRLALAASLTRTALSYEELYIEMDGREKIQSTAIGNGVALPHSRFPHRLMCREPRLIMARSIAGVSFNAPDNKKVHLFFLPCAPNPFAYLRIMAQIARLLHVPDLTERLKRASRKKDVLDIIGSATGGRF